MVRLVQDENMENKIDSHDMDTLVTDQLEMKILMSLTEKPKTFEELLRLGIILSRATLSNKLKSLAIKKFIKKRPGSKKNPYEINKLVFNRTPLYPRVMAALFSKSIKNVWLMMFPTLKEKIDKIMDSKKIVDKETRAELYAEYTIIAEKSIKNLEQVIGQTIMEALVFQTETDLPVTETMSNLIRFLYIEMIKKDTAIKSIYRKSESYTITKKIFAKPYDDVEESLIEEINMDMHYNYIIEKIHGNKSPLLREMDEFYDEIGFPYNVLYKKKEVKQHPPT
ncbi:MAG: hypothetical protein KKA10_07325 [Euryarchaeota archaeon]|nr:hypothetical protein [Euryarchaeota archaeon]MCG2734928.1 hypothetical protein [Candidatus Methanoperedenaceae archaeon]